MISAPTGNGQMTIVMRDGGRVGPSHPPNKENSLTLSKAKALTRNAAPQGNKGGKQKVAEVQICTDCSCALGLNAACQTCSTLAPPPEFEYKEPRQVFPRVCQAQNDKGEVCCNPLGRATNCDLCKEHRKFWSSFQVMTTWPTLPTDKKCESMQLDRILYDLDILTDEPKLYEELCAEMRKKLEHADEADLKRVSLITFMVATVGMRIESSTLEIHDSLPTSLGETSNCL